MRRLGVGLTPLGRSVVLALAIHVVVTWLRALARGRRARTEAAECRAPTSVSEDRSPRISVLVPAWRDATVLRRCLESLDRVEYPAWETIVIAGGPDGTYEVAREAIQSHSTWRVIEQCPGGKNAALNRGLREAHGEVIVVLDADSVVAPDWLERLMEPLRRGADAAVGSYLPLRVTPVSQVEQMEKLSTYLVRRGRHLQGAGSIAVTRAALEAIDGFPPDVKVGVDWDLGVRLARQGCRIAFAKDARVWTERAATLREFWRNEVRWRRAHLASLVRHRDVFLARPSTAAVAFYFYGLAATTVVATIALAVSGVWLTWQRLGGGRRASGVPWTGSFRGLLTAWILAVSWLGLRRASLAGEVAIYTGDLRWLKIAWAPPLLLFVSFAAAVVALLSLSRQSASFKGPRPEMRHA